MTVTFISTHSSPCLYSFLHVSCGLSVALNGWPHVYLTLAFLSCTHILCSILSLQITVCTASRPYRPVHHHCKQEWAQSLILDVIPTHLSLLVHTGWNFVPLFLQASLELTSLHLCHLSLSLSLSFRVLLTMTMTNYYYYYATFSLFFSFLNPQLGLVVPLKVFNPQFGC